MYIYINTRRRHLLGAFFIFIFYTAHAVGNDFNRLQSTACWEQIKGEKKKKKIREEKSPASSRNNSSQVCIKMFGIRFLYYVFSRSRRPWEFAAILSVLCPDVTQLDRCFLWRVQFKLFHPKYCWTRIHTWRTTDIFCIKLHCSRRIPIYYYN